jgi:hypothetical protein
LEGEKIMGALVPEYEVQATTVATDPGTGRVVIGLQTDQGPVALYLDAGVLVLLKVGIERLLAQDKDKPKA